MNAYWTWGTILAVTASLIIWTFAPRARRSTLPLPPGPPGLPIIGNILDVPTKDMAATFRDMNAKYGDIVYLDALGQPMIILGTHDAAIDLFEKRSAIYSDRSEQRMAQLSGLDWVLTLLRYGPWWRRHRRTFHQFFNASTVLEYRPMQQREARRFALRLVEGPGSLIHHIRRLFGSTVMRIAYGIEIDDGNEEYLTLAERALAIFSSVSVPGKYLVETLPFLQHLPAWFPGAHFKREAAQYVPVIQEILHRAWDKTVAAVKVGNAPPSMVATLLERISQLPPAEAVEEETVARDVAAIAYGAGADTTFSTVQTFFLAMAANPETQAKAQAELDAVVGANRLPEFADAPALPYVCALTKELLRWRSVVPLGIPHRAVEEDEYRGFRIPKGSVVISNIWAYSRDPKVYPDPEAFRPERFLKDGQLDPDVREPSTIAFGYGRRICPGRYFAESSLFIIASTVLHTLSITAAEDAQGRPVPLSGKMTEGILSYPEPFECVVKPRSSAAESLIRESCGQMQM